MKRFYFFFLSLILCVGIAVESAEGGRGITLTVVYDNYALTEGTKPDGGFSCLIEGTDKTILFDTGARGDILLGNMEVLGIDPAATDVVVISHIHNDHVGGLDSILNIQSDLSVHMISTI